MKLQLSLFLLAVLSCATCSAFTPSQKVTRQEPLRTSTSLNDAKQHYNTNGSSNLNLWKSLTKAGTSFAAAAAIFGSALVSDMAVAPAPALADVELSSGAFIIQTAAATKSGDQSNPQSLRMTEIDSKSLIKTLLANRKDLAASFGRIQSAVIKEFSEPVWMELQKEILDIEGDISSAVKITPPADWRQAVKDLTSGKVNFLLNGEIVNVSVEPNFSETEDDLIIRVKGFKGERLPGTFYAPVENARGPAVGPLRAKLAEYQAVWDWWDEPYPTQYLPVGGMQATNGGIILTGAAGSVGLVYIAAYVYYLDQIDQEKAASEARQAKLAEKAALKKKKEAEQAAKDADDNMRVENLKKKKEAEQADKDADDNLRVETLKAYKKKEAEKAKAGEDDDGNVIDKKGWRLRFWKK